MKQIIAFPEDSSSYHLVNFGVDTLVLNVRYVNPSGNASDALLPDPIIACLNAWQEIAREKEEPVATSLTFRGMQLLMYPHGAGKGQWRWLLNCPAFKLYVSRGRLNGVIAQVRFAAPFLWSAEDVETRQQDIWPLIVEVSEFLSFYLTYRGEAVALQVSEVHLCADLVGWDVSTCDWQHSFLSRARTRIDRAEDSVAGGAPVAVVTGRRLSTLNFGTHGSPLSCCIYNKSLEIQTAKKLWMLEVFKRHGYDGVAEVWRIEFRWKREALHEIKQEGVFHGIESIEDLAEPDRLSYLWTYCTGHTQDGQDGWPDGWLRYAQPLGTDPNMSRWSVHPAWRVVQSAFCKQTEPVVNILTGEVLDIPVSSLADLIRERQREVHIQRLAQQVGGCASTLAAWLGDGDTLPAVFAHLVKHLPAYALPELAKVAPADLLQQAYERLFTERVEEKRVIYGLEAMPEREVQHG